MMKKKPAFKLIQEQILNNIHNGIWSEGMLIPSELKLADQFKVSRMTVNKAIHNLVAERILIRRQGSGTFVAQKKYQTTHISINSIAEEVKQRGHSHSSELFSLAKVKTNAFLLTTFHLKKSSANFLFHSLILHFENDIPIQVEERWVNPLLAPDYMQQNFNFTTPNEYLINNIPLQKGEYVIEARRANRTMSDMLKITLNAPCLVLSRRTFSQDDVVTYVEMWHPGERYQFAGEY